MVNHPSGGDYRFFIITVPFLEEYTSINLDPNTMSKYDGMVPPNKIIPMKGTLQWTLDSISRTAPTR